MGDELQAPFSLHVEPCPDDASRYRWTVRDREHAFRQCVYSLPREQEAYEEGQKALAEAAALWRDSH